MTATTTTSRRLLADDSGATAIEYALLAALIAGVLTGTVATLGETVLYGLFRTVSSQVSSYIDGTS